MFLSRVLIILIPTLFIIYKVVKSNQKDAKEQKQQDEKWKLKVDEAKRYLEFCELARKYYILYKASGSDPKKAVVLLETMKRSMK